MESEQKLIELIKRTSKFHNAVSRIFNDLIILDDPRCMVSFPSVSLSMEHAIGAHTLIMLGINSSGYILYRPQFETLIRGMWLLYAASDSYCEDLLKQMSLEIKIKEKDNINLTQMLKQLEKSEAPKHIIEDLIKFRDLTLKSLNSFIHGGYLPMVMTAIKYPPELSINALLNSNILVAIASQLAVILSDDQTKMELVKDLHVQFSDCIVVI
jgi:hypothetical protein